MLELEKISHMVLLKDFYGPLLTEKQRIVISLHYEHDLSLTEIADNMNITRQAVFDLLKRAENILEEYEESLHLVSKFLYTRHKLSQVCAMLNNDHVDQEVVRKAVELLREIVETV